MACSLGCNCSTLGLDELLARTDGPLACFSPRQVWSRHLIRLRYRASRIKTRRISAIYILIRLACHKRRKERKKNKTKNKKRKEKKKELCKPVTNQKPRSHMNHNNTVDKQISGHSSRSTKILLASKLRLICLHYMLAVSP